MILSVKFCDKIFALYIEKWFFLMAPKLKHKLGSLDSICDKIMYEFL